MSFSQNRENLIPQILCTLLLTSWLVMVKLNKTKFNNSRTPLCTTRIIVQGQLVEPAVCFSDVEACEDLIHSFIRQKPNNIILRQQIFFLIL